MLALLYTNGLVGGLASTDEDLAKYREELAQLDEEQLGERVTVWRETMACLDTECTKAREAGVALEDSIAEAYGLAKTGLHLAEKALFELRLRTRRVAEEQARLDDVDAEEVEPVTGDANGGGTGGDPPG